jgi:hypothetical protein
MKDRRISQLNTRLRCFSEESKNFKLSKVQSSNTSKTMEDLGPKVRTTQVSKPQMKMPYKKSLYRLS